MTVPIDLRLLDAVHVVCHLFSSGCRSYRADSPVLPRHCPYWPQQYPPPRLPARLPARLPLHPHLLRPEHLGSLASSSSHRSLASCPRREGRPPRLWVSELGRRRRPCILDRYRGWSGGGCRGSTRGGGYHLKHRIKSKKARRRRRTVAVVANDALVHVNYGQIEQREQTVITTPSHFLHCCT